MVERVGDRKLHIGISSNPIMDTSPGILMPASVRARIAPAAIRSLSAKYASAKGMPVARRVFISR